MDDPEVAGAEKPKHVPHKSQFGEPRMHTRLPHEQLVEVTLYAFEFLGPAVPFKKPVGPFWRSQSCRGFAITSINLKLVNMFHFCRRYFNEVEIVRETGLG